MAHQGPPDVNELAYRVVAAVTSEEPEEVPDARQVESGRKGGEARAKSLTPEQRSDIARKGAAARWQQPTA